MAPTAWGAVSFNVSPSAVSNLYGGTITLQIGELNAGETVRIDKFLDANRNGGIDAGDLMVQSFPLTDGQASVIGGVTNINVPGDFGSTSGAITAQLRIAGDVAQQIVAQYIYLLSSPSSRFAPINALFNVTNSAYAQSFAGMVRHGGTNVPNVIVMAVPEDSQDRGPFAGVMADNSGSYTLNLPGGTYTFWLLKSNFVADLSQAPMLTLSNGTTFTTNLNGLIAANTSISGRIVDAANTNTGLPGIFLFCQTTDRQFMVGACYTDSNGAFSVPVVGGRWEVGMNHDDPAVHGYLAAWDQPQVDAGTGSVSGVTVALPKANALFYGSVTNNLGNPLARIDIVCWNDNYPYEAECYTDTSGYFVAAVVGGLSNVLWQVEVSSDTAPTNYIFSRPSFNQNGGTNISAGQALPVNFTALLATRQISGSVADATNQQPIAGVSVYAHAPDINGLSYNTHTHTDGSGHYALPAVNGTWYVGLSSSGGDDSLESLGFQCVDQQGTNILNSDVVVDFMVEPLPDVRSYYIMKLEAFLQLDPTHLVLNTNNGPYHAYLGLVQLEPDLVKLANVALPSGGFRALPWDDSEIELQTHEKFPDQASIDAIYPPGKYSFGLYAWHDGLQFPDLWMPPAAYPNPPRVSNFAAAQSVDPHAPFTLQWDTISGATDNDTLWVLVTDSFGDVVFSTPRPSTDRLAALRGTATSVDIPANTLQAGDTYRGHIVFIRTTSVDLGQYPGAAGVTLVAAQTSLPLVVVSTAPLLSQPVRLSDTQVGFQLSGLAGQDYTVQVSTNLASTNWFTLLTTNLSQSQVFIQDDGATNQQRFYRAMLGQ